MKPLRNYLSFGGGVNSVAMLLLLLDEGMTFGPNKDCEAVYCWVPDWPQTHEYILMMEERGYPITILTPKDGNLYDYAWRMKMFPNRNPRWCTRMFKIKTMHAFFQKPCFVLLGIDAGESHRARMSSDDGMENRYPLIERGITRKDCIEIIKAHGLPIPIKSGCYICPFQRVSQFKTMRRTHPELFCKVVDLENRNNEYRATKGKEPYYTMKKPLTEIINERDAFLFEEMDWPPCTCGL